MVFDATHLVQQPGGKDGVGWAARVRAVAGAGRRRRRRGGGIMETHPDPDKAPSDGPNMIPMKQLPAVLEVLIHSIAFRKAHPVAL